MRRLLAVAGLVWLLAAIPAPATAADPVMTVSVGHVHVVGKVLANVEVTFTCQTPAVPAGMEGGFDSAGLSVEIRQGSGRHIATGSGGVDFDARTMCDGRPHHRVVPVPVDPGGRTFKTGRAAIDAWGGADFSWWDPETGEGSGIGQTADTGWIPTRLTR